MIIELDGLQIKIGDGILFVPANIKFKPGEIYCIRGRSGAGKTSLLHSIAGREKRHINGSGIKYHFLHNLDKNEKKSPILGEDLILLQQSYPLWPHLTSLQNTWVPWASLKGMKEFFKRKKSAFKMASSWLEKLEIEPYVWKKKPVYCSGGEKQRISLASKLLFDCPSLLLDEPTSSLDRTSTDLVIDILESQANQGKLIIIVSHDLDLISKSSWNHLEIVDSPTSNKNKFLCEVSK